MVHVLGAVTDQSSFTSGYPYSLPPCLLLSTIYRSFLQLCLLPITSNPFQFDNVKTFPSWNSSAILCQPKISRDPSVSLKEASSLEMYLELPAKDKFFFFFFFFEISFLLFFFYLFYLFFLRLITLQYCSGFCHTLTWISHGFTCIPNPNPPSHLPFYLIPLGLPSAPGLSTCLMHPTCAGDLFHYR